MIEFLIRRVVAGMLLVLAVSLIIFSLMRIVPASPALLILGADAPMAQIQAFESMHGLDQPLLVQYWHWISGIITRFDFGVSYVSGMSITQELQRTLPVTLELVIVAMLMCVAVAIPLGVISALRSGSLLDHALRVVAIMGVSMPGFWVGLLFILWFSVQLNWFPPGDFAPLSDGFGAHVKSIFLPALSLGIYYVAIISRMTRSSVLEVLGKDYVRTGLAMGLPKHTILLSYVLKNAMIPVVSVIAMSCGYMFGWAIVIEQVFNIPGICRALLTAVFSRDYNVVQAIVLVITAAFVTLNLCADVSYRLLNPKVTW